MSTNDIIKLQGSVLKDDYLEFFKFFWKYTSNDPLIYNWHLGFLAAELQEVGSWIINRQPRQYDLLINVPPGTSKSTLTSVMFHPWLWANMPECRIITGSHTGSLMVRNSSKSKDIIKSEEYRAMFDYIGIRSDFDSKYYYKNTMGGERINTSAGASIIGSHAHLILIDDPIDAKGSRSEAKVLQAKDWVEKTLPTRKVEKANTPLIMIMQRLSEDDPSGVWLEAMKKEGRPVRHICLPASDEYPISPPEARQYYQGGLLDPKRMPQAELDKLLGVLGSIEYAGQFGQSPTAGGGNIITESMLPVLDWNRLPEGFNELSVNFVVDSSDKTGKENDPTGILAYVAYKGYVFLVDYIKVKQRFAKRIESLQAFVRKYGHPNSRIYIEPKSSGVAMYQYLTDVAGMLAEEWKMAEGDKVRRAKAITPFMEQHRVWLLRGSWNQRFISQCTGFPNMAHDEEVDCLVMAVTNALVRGEDSHYNFYD
jgi:predicted phage terminase large subunit-like protein